MTFWSNKAVTVYLVWNCVSFSRRAHRSRPAVSHCHLWPGPAKVLWMMNLKIDGDQTELTVQTDWILGNIGSASLVTIVTESWSWIYIATLKLAPPGTSLKTAWSGSKLCRPLPSGLCPHSRPHKALYASLSQRDLGTRIEELWELSLDL